MKCKACSDGDCDGDYDKRYKCQNKDSCSCYCKSTSGEVFFSSLLSIGAGVGVAAAGIGLTVATGGIAALIGGAAIAGGGTSLVLSPVQKLITKESMTIKDTVKDVALGATIGAATGPFGVLGSSASKAGTIAVSVGSRVAMGSTAAAAANVVAEMTKKGPNDESEGQNSQNDDKNSNKENDDDKNSNKGNENDSNNGNDGNNYRDNQNNQSEEESQSESSEIESEEEKEEESTINEDVEDSAFDECSDWQAFTVGPYNIASNRHPNRFSMEIVNEIDHALPVSAWERMTFVYLDWETPRQMPAMLISGIVHRNMRSTGYSEVSRRFIADVVDAGNQSIHLAYMLVFSDQHNTTIQVRRELTDIIFPQTLRRELIQLHRRQRRLVNYLYNLGLLTAAETEALLNFISEMARNGSCLEFLRKYFKKMKIPSNYIDMLKKRWQLCSKHGKSKKDYDNDPKRRK